MSEEKQLPTLEVTGTFDIETQNWDRFVLGGIYAKSGFESYDWRREDDYVDDLLGREGTYWGFNAGRFDSLHIIEHMHRHDIRDVRVFAAGQRITCVEYGNLRLRDAAAISGPMDFKNFSKIGKHPKTATGLPCDCGTCPDKSNGFCRIYVGMPEEDLIRLREYNFIDCLGLHSALDCLVDFCARHTIALMGTIGASAFATVKHSQGIGDSPWCSKRASKRPDSIGTSYRQAQKSYFGGRTQVFRPRAESGHRYDMNSAYPAALAALQLPIGPGDTKLGPAAAKAFGRGAAGLYTAEVEVAPRTFIPPLPVRTAERIAYPIGRFKGSWTATELQHAVAVGVQVLRVSRAMVWDEVAPIMAPFCEHVYALRDANRDNKGLFKWLKNLGNSVSGKLAQRPEVTEIILGPSSPKACPGGRRRCKAKNCRQHERMGCCELTCFRMCGAHFPLDKAGYVVAQKSFRVPQCGYIHWAAYLTSFARVCLHTQLISDGQGGATCLYCDTDSCYATEERTWNIDEHRLGAWKYEGWLRQWEALAPKTYAYLAPDDEDETQLHRHARSKGVPDAATNWERLASGVLIDRGVLSLRSAARSESGNLFQK